MKVCTLLVIFLFGIAYAAAYDDSSAAGMQSLSADAPLKVMIVNSYHPGWAL